jgi:hypothetical protein
MNALGSLNGEYKEKANNRKFTSTHDQFSILSIVERLEGYKKYQQQIRKEIKKKEDIKVKKLLKRIRKESFRKAYFRQPVLNPYIEMYEKHRIAVDPKLEARYNSRPLYTFYEFRHLHLPRSGYEIQAGQAWNGLIKSWKGYEISKSMKKKVLTKRYAFTTQRWAWMLDLPMIPDFPESSLESFMNSQNISSSTQF